MTTDPQTTRREQIRRVLAEADGFTYEGLEPHDYQRHADALLALDAVPVVRPELRDQIAEALSEARRPGLGGMTEAEAVAHMADAVLSVLPATTNRAAVLRDAAERVLNADHLPFVSPMGRKDVHALLRRLATETPQLPSVHANDVQGFCPACGHGVLMLGEGGHVVCTLIDCPNPDAADELLRTHQPAVVAAVAGEAPDDETQSVQERICTPDACPPHCPCHAADAAASLPGKEEN